MTRHTFFPDRYDPNLDLQDPLSGFKDRFHLPVSPDGQAQRYFCGNSLGLQPLSTREHVLRELDDWARFGVEGHIEARFPWVRYHEFLTENMAKVVGALPSEVVVMNTLTVNLHLMMVSFYRPTPKRHKILIEFSAFPSDRYAVESQIRFHGYDPNESLIVLEPDSELEYVSHERIREVIDREGDHIALILIGSVNYYTGQAYPIKKITEWGHEKGCAVGFDLAHGAGNLLLDLHGEGPDFAVWCSYKYLNSGPGSLAGCFVHERHERSFDLPRFAGWWGHDKANRFKMEPTLRLMPGAEGWQLSNPPILPMACMMASLELFDQAGMSALRQKSLSLHQCLREQIEAIGHPNLRLLTPASKEEHGCQLSIQLLDANRKVHQRLTENQIITDWREPDVIRVAPVPLYNTFEDVYLFSQKLKEALNEF